MSGLHLPKDWTQTSFDELNGWFNDDHEAAFSCFRVSARALIENPQQSRIAIPPPAQLLIIAKKALAISSDKLSAKSSRAFFEENFVPLIHKNPGGFVTGYFEPEITASRLRTRAFNTPLYARPDDLANVDEHNGKIDLPAGYEFGKKTDNGIVEYFDRAEIENGALAGKKLELFWLRSPVDAFFLHIQGSARLLLENDVSVRVSYAGKNGHPYTPIGKLLVERGELVLDEVSMESIRGWLETNQNDGLKLMQENRSFIFFQEVKSHNPEFGPIAAAGVQLTPGRSLAVDRKIHAYGLPIWISTQRPLPMEETPFRRLMVAQDTGSAIVGPQRGDLFIGSGHEAGEVAGSIKHKADFSILWPKTGD